MECTSKLILFRKFRWKCFESNEALDAFRVNPISVQDDDEQDVLMEICNNTELCHDDDDDEEAESGSDASTAITIVPVMESDEIDLESAKVDSIAAISVLLKDEYSEAEYLLDDQPKEKELEDLPIGANFVKTETDENNIRWEAPSPIETEYLEDEEADSNPESIVLAQTNPICPFVCLICGYQFTRKSSLKQHMLSHSHNGHNKRFTCEICSEGFTRKPHLVCHMRIHLDQRPFSCPECEKSFVKASDMERHRAIHSDRRPFTCPVCDKRFKRSNDVTTHMFTHTGHKPYKCKGDPLCGKSYGSHSSLKKHMLRYHHHNNGGVAKTTMVDDGWTMKEEEVELIGEY